MDTEKLGRVLCAISPSIANIGADERFNDCVRLIVEKQDQNLNKVQKAAALIGTFTPFLLGEEHRDDTFAILAALREKSIDEIRNQNSMETLNDLRICFSEFSGFIDELTSAS